MSLPLSYNDYGQYFEDTVDFLIRYSWIFDTSNTRFAADGVLDKFPTEWVDYFLTISTEDLNSFPYGGMKKSSMPQSLKDFQNEAQPLKPYRSEIRNVKTDIHYFKAASPKKIQEIIKLSSLITEVCHDEVEILLDFGSGLGYLSQMLFMSHKFKIIGFESNSERVKSAHERQEKFYPKSKQYIHYRAEKIVDDSETTLKIAVHESFGADTSAPLAIIGLHACADLSITAIKLFLKMDTVKKLIIMPCCYHKLDVISIANDDGHKKFKNFPLSEKLTKVFNKYFTDYGKIFSRPFLRLACQQTAAKWQEMSIEEHNRHGKEMFCRGLAECLIVKEREVIEKKRHVEKHPEFRINFENLTSLYGIKLINSNKTVDWTEDHKEKFTRIYNKYPFGDKLSEALTCLQLSIQEICENLLLLDRVCFIEEYSKERGPAVRVKTVKVIDDKLSPRCFALVATK